MLDANAKRRLLWIVATALFMEQLDATIVNTAVPAIAASLQVAPLSQKAVVTSYILSLAICIPLSGWMADRFGTRRVFAAALALFTLASVWCGAASGVPMLVAARILQGLGAAMMMPVGRLLVIRSVAKSELMVAMNFVIVPALIGPLLGPVVGGLIVHWLSWRAIFLVNVPIGLVALWLICRHVPDYRSATPRRLDLVGWLLFSSATTLLSWLLGVFGDHAGEAHFGARSVAAGLLAIGLLGLYSVHAHRTPHPLLSLALLRIRTFRVAVLGGSLTRLGLGAMPFLLPLLFQLGLGLPAWQSGLLLMPLAAAAMLMKMVASRILARHGYRTVLIVNTLMIGVTISLFSCVDAGSSLGLVVALCLAQGFFNSLQFSSMNSMAFADIDAPNASMASGIASTLQQLSMSLGLALGSLLTAYFLGDLPQSDRVAVSSALHHAFLTLGALTMASSLSFWTLRAHDGEAVSQRGLSRA